MKKIKGTVWDTSEARCIKRKNNAHSSLDIVQVSTESSKATENKMISLV